MTAPPPPTQALDWIDGILFSLGFVVIVAAATALSLAGVHASRGAMKVLVLGVAFSPLAVRRALFGAPVRPPPRTGALWSLLSIVGLFAILLGAGAMALGGDALVDTLAAPPDFDAQVAADFAHEGPSLSVSFGTSSPESGAAQHEAEALEQRRLATALRTAWVASNQDRRKTAIILSLVGLLAMAAGAVCLRLRYPPASSRSQLLPTP